MWFIGDIHGNFAEYLRLRSSIDQSLALGDIGLGFPSTQDLDVIPTDNRHRLLRGNHDNPQFIKRHPNILPDWGYNPKMDLFWVSGAFSIDYGMRVAGLTWWPDEELERQELLQAVETYLEVKPRYVATHDCPFTVCQLMFPFARKSIQSQTVDALERMWNAHKPEYWLFAHYHFSKKIVVNDSTCICCDCLRQGQTNLLSSAFEVPGLVWQDA